MCSEQSHLLSSRSVHTKGETKYKTHKVVTALPFLLSPPHMWSSVREGYAEGTKRRRPWMEVRGLRDPKQDLHPACTVDFHLITGKHFPNTPFGSESYASSTSFQNALSLRILICVRKRAEQTQLEVQSSV